MRKLIFLLSFIRFIVFATDNNANIYMSGLEPDTLTYKEIYNFQVGDQFQYIEESYTSSGGSMPTHRTTTKYLITSKEVLNNTFSYEITGINKYEFWCAGHAPTCVYESSSRRFNDILIYVDSINHFLNQPKDSLVTGFYYGQDFYSRIKINNDGLILLKEIGGYGNLFVYDNNDSLVEEQHSSYMAKYGRSVGLVEENYGGFEHGSYIKLDGYVKDNDTTGNISSDDDLLVSFNETKGTNISLYPNPAEGYIFIDAGDLGSGIYIVEIFNYNGEIVLKDKLSEGPIDINDLVKGIYMLRIRFSKGLFIRKLIVR